MGGARCTPECVHFRPWWIVHDVQWCTWCTIQVFFWSWWGEHDAALALKDCTWCTPAQEYLWPWWTVCLHLYMCTSDDADEWNRIHVHVYGCTSDLGGLYVYTCTCVRLMTLMNETWYMFTCMGVLLTLVDCMCTPVHVYVWWRWWMKHDTCTPVWVYFEGLYMMCISTGLNFWRWWITRNAQLSHKARVGKKRKIHNIVRFKFCMLCIQIPSLSLTKTKHAIQTTQKSDNLK